MSVAEIAQQLARSKAWVSLRLGLMAQLSPTVREVLFAGAFPVYSYLYSLRPFRRLNPAADVDQFVRALGGKKLSVREIEGLAHGFFRGPESFRQEVLRGNLCLPLQQIQAVPQDPHGCPFTGSTAIPSRCLEIRPRTALITERAKSFWVCQLNFAACCFEHSAVGPRRDFRVGRDTTPQQRVPQPIKLTVAGQLLCLQVTRR